MEDPSFYRLVILNGADTRRERIDPLRFSVRIQAGVGHSVETGSADGVCSFRQQRRDKASAAACLRLPRGLRWIGVENRAGEGSRIQQPIAGHQRVFGASPLVERARSAALRRQPLDTRTGLPTDHAELRAGRMRWAGQQRHARRNGEQDTATQLKGS